MAVKPQIKANQLAKDLGLKSKEIVDIMAEKGIELKTQKSLEAHEFNVLFDALTSSHQIEGIDDYIDGITYIESKKKKPEAKAEAKAARKAEKEAAKEAAEQPQEVPAKEPAEEETTAETPVEETPAEETAVEETPTEEPEQTEGEVSEDA